MMDQKNIVFLLSELLHKIRSKDAHRAKKTVTIKNNLPDKFFLFFKKTNRPNIKEIMAVGICE